MFAGQQLGGAGVVMIIGGTTNATTSNTVVTVADSFLSHNTAGL
jgi:hypothetical protein